jgi:glycosyltransferase involved in cell wall biosynthesis
MAYRFRWTVSQIGARQHYALPRGFIYKSQLRQFYTDAWCRRGARLLTKHGPRGVRAFGTRWHPHIASRKVTAFTASALMTSNLMPPAGVGTDELFDFYLRQGKWFAERVARHFGRQRIDPEQDHFFGFDSTSLETLDMLRDRGVFTVLDQIDPGRTEEEIVFEEAAKWPGWQQAPGRIPNAYFERLGREWEVAELILVNSDWSRLALMRQGVPAEKICIVPMAYEPKLVYVRPKTPAAGPLNVLWLGKVNLRKGIPYLIEAARQLSEMRFTVAGPLEISTEAVASAPANVEFLGRITRDRTAEIYGAADVFVLPTMSDGFAITQLEAMGHGLPVVATPNCGKVVTDGVDGVIVPAGDANALAKALVSLDADRDLMREMSRQAIAKVGSFRLPNQADQIEAEVRRRRGEATGRGVPAVTDSTVTARLG